MDLGDRKELSPSANLTLISVLGQWDPSFFRGCGKLIQLHFSLPALEQVSANRYVTMVIYQKLLPRTKKRGVFYLSLKISSLNRLASYDEYPHVVICSLILCCVCLPMSPHVVICSLILCCVCLPMSPHVVICSLILCCVCLPMSPHVRLLTPCLVDCLPRPDCLHLFLLT